MRLEHRLTRSDIPWFVMRSFANKTRSFNVKRLGRSLAHLERYMYTYKATTNTTATTYTAARFSSEAHFAVHRLTTRIDVQKRGLVTH